MVNYITVASRGLCL